MILTRKEAETVLEGRNDNTGVLGSESEKLESRCLDREVLLHATTRSASGVSVDMEEGGISSTGRHTATTDCYMLADCPRALLNFGHTHTRCRGHFSPRHDFVQVYNRLAIGSHALC
jgi:hypothetical protein